MGDSHVYGLARARRNRKAAVRGHVGRWKKPPAAAFSRSPTRGIDCHGVADTCACLRASHPQAGAERSGSQDERARLARGGRGFRPDVFDAAEFSADLVRH
jgi:hypothetical protein